MKKQKKLKRNSIDKHFVKIQGNYYVEKLENGEVNVYRKAGKNLYYFIQHHKTIQEAKDKIKKFLNKKR